MAEQTATLRYLQKAHANKTFLKVYLESGGNQPKTMLKGVVTDFDGDAIVLDACLIPITRIISVAPHE